MGLKARASKPRETAAVVRARADALGAGRPGGPRLRAARLQSAHRYGLRLPRPRSPPRALAAGPAGQSAVRAGGSHERRLLRRDREAETIGRTQVDPFAGR